MRYRVEIQRAYNLALGLFALKLAVFVAWVSIVVGSGWLGVLGGVCFTGAAILTVLTFRDIVRGE